jgi:alginate O-acetyltransferase complex protein AlgI
MGLMADTIFALDSSYINVASAWIAGITYTLQIYFDFSGYSDMAIGISRVFGFEFKENFNYPYVATSMQNFWRRWHISLSTWFKEYLYIPLGGNRKGSLRTVLNKVFVFFCTGLWHGANFTFIVWGLMHGLLLLLEYYNIIPIEKCKFRPLKHFYTMVCVVVTFVMFRAVDVSQGFMYIKQMFTGFNVSVQSLSPILELVTPSFIITLVLGIVFSMPVEKALTHAVAKTKGRTVLAIGEYALTLGLVLICILSLYTSEYNPFIYLNF